MYNKCNVLESYQNFHLPPSVEKIVFHKLVPGAKKFQDCCSKESKIFVCLFVFFLPPVLFFFVFISYKTLFSHQREAESRDLIPFVSL